MISEGPEALKKYIASGAIEELNDVMPHDDDEDLNAAYLDDDEPNPSAALDVALPTPLQSAKIAQSVQTQPLDSKEKPRKSRFSDITDAESSMDTDMRSYNAPSNQENFGNGRPNDMKSNYQDMDYRTANYEQGNETYNKNDDFEPNRPMDVDFRNRYDNYNSEENSNFSGNNYGDREWNQNENFQKPANSQNENFGFRGNQNGSFGSNGPMGNFQHGNFPRAEFGQGPRGPMPPFGNNFRPDGNWSNMPQRPENFRNRGNFNQRMPMRGGPMRGNPRGFPGPRGPGIWGPPRGNGPPPRGRNVF